MYLIAFVKNAWEVKISSLRAKRGNPCSLEASVMDRHGLRPRDDGKQVF
jgi:hypothetical protein